uniref:BED-type domain-containing protein n=1 Tax=Astatotilapia calliptera TaxID=8154 RepID=A0A3P8NPQ8_ASTCA
SRISESRVQRKAPRLQFPSTIMAAVEDGPGMCFLSWKYSHYFSFVLEKDRNIVVNCTLCGGSKTLSTSKTSNSYLMKHLQKQHASTNLVEKEPVVGDSSSVDAIPAKQRKLDFGQPAAQSITQPQLHRLIARYVVEDMKPISTVESHAFRQLISHIPVRGRAGKAPSRKIFSSFLDQEYANMESELKNTLDMVEYISTTADIWTVHNKSFLGVTAHWINAQNMKREKAALACRRFMGRHTYDSIASELDNINSSHGLSFKITSTVTDNGSNFVKAFKVYQPAPESDDSESEEDGVTFVSIGDVLQNAADDADYAISLPPHQRCASHTMNLISCTDVEKWLLSEAATKTIYRSATTKCAGLWNKASRSTVAAEIVDDIIAKKLLVPCTTRWNSFYYALERISKIPVVELNTISSTLRLKCFNEREHQCIREYCAVMKPLTVALDILQGEDHCFYGTLLPTLESLMTKTLAIKNACTFTVSLLQAVKTRFAHVLGSEDALLAAVILPKFKLRTSATNTTQHAGSSKEDEFFSFEENEDIYATAEGEVAEYLKSGATGLDSLNHFPMIKKLSLKLNAATPSSAPVERLFSLGNLILTPKRNKLTDHKFEKLLLLRYNRWFDGTRVE